MPSAWVLEEGMVLVEPSLRGRPRGPGRRLHGRHLPRPSRGRRGALAARPLDLYVIRVTRSRRPDPRLGPAAARARDHAGDGDGADALVAVADLQRDRRPRHRRLRSRWDARSPRPSTPRSSRTAPGRRCRYILERFADDLHDGDVILHNDVYTGGNQNADVGVYLPVFHERRARRVDGEQGPRRRHRRHDRRRLRPERARGLAGGVPDPAAQARRPRRAARRTSGSSSARTSGSTSSPRTSSR